MRTTWHDALGVVPVVLVSSIFAFDLPAFAMRAIRLIRSLYGIGVHDARAVQVRHGAASLQAEA